jgi:hypothetical protein
MKTVLALFLALLPASAVAQDKSTASAAAPGCGTDNTKFGVKTDRYQHPFAKPDSGKALVYFLQDDTDFLSRPRPTTRFGLDGSWIGATQSDAYFYFLWIPANITSAPTGSRLLASIKVRRPPPLISPPRREACIFLSYTITLATTKALPE